MGAGGDPYLVTFLGAALSGLFLFYGFEACGSVAEEVNDAARRIPRAMIMTILIGGVSGLLSYAGYVLAAPDLQAIVDGEEADPIPAILEDTLGTVGAKLFLLVRHGLHLVRALAAGRASRLLYGPPATRCCPERWLARMSERHAVPTNALLVACIVPIAICLYVYWRRITCRASQRSRCWASTSHSRPWSWPLFGSGCGAGVRPASGTWVGTAFGQRRCAAYGIFAMFLLIKPADTFLDRWIVAIGSSSFWSAGYVYVIARPYRHWRESGKATPSRSPPTWTLRIGKGTK